MLRRDLGLGQADAHRDRGRRIVTGRALDDLGHAREPRDLVGRREVGIVGDVVALAREAIEGMHVRAQVGADQERADGKILVVAALARWRLQARAHAPPSAYTRPFHWPPRPR